jgi:hypothetical protein
MESCQNHFWGALNTPPPKKKSIFFQEQDISQEREFVASQIGNYKKILLNVQTYMGGQSYYLPPLHSLHEGWRNFFPVVLLCQFLVLAGNRFWFYILMYLEYNTVVVLC